MLWFFGAVSFDGEEDQAPAAFSVTLMETFGKPKRYCSHHRRTALFIIYKRFIFQL